jgi:hypothetical protein
MTRFGVMKHLKLLEETGLRARPGIAESDLTGDSRACVVCVA